MNERVRVKGGGLYTKVVEIVAYVNAEFNVKYTVSGMTD